MEWPSLIFNILMDWQGYPEVMIDDHHMGRIYTKQNAVRMMNVRNYICAKMGPQSHCWGSTWLHSGWSELFLWVWVIAQLDQNAKGLNWTKIKKIERDFGTQKNTNIPINIIYNIISDFWSMEVCVFQILARPHGCHPYTWCCLGHAGFDLLGQYNWDSDGEEPEAGAPRRLPCRCFWSCISLVVGWHMFRISFDQAPGIAIKS